MEQIEQKNQLPWGGVGIAMPVFCILLGMILLANNLHWVSWTVWQTIWRFWPIFLIGAGLEYMVARRFQYGSLAVLIFMVVALSGAVVLHSTGQDRAASHKPAPASPAP